MKKRYYLIILLLNSEISNAQNLIPNGDFEQYSSCPTNYSQLSKAVPWFTPTIMSSSDYFNQCDMGWLSVPINNWGYQPAHSGIGYCGIFLFNLIMIDYREYAEVQLLSPLTANSCYRFEMYVNLGNDCQFTTDAIGVYFSDSAINNIPIMNWNPLPVTPQITNSAGIFDTLNWTLVSGNYTAHGGETHLIIGNYNNDAATNLISIYPAAQWGTYCYIDDVSLSICTGIENQNQKDAIRIHPNPFSNKLIVDFRNNKESEIILYDVSSRKLLQEKFINSVSLNTEQLAKGIYLYEVKNKNGVIKKGRVVKD